MMSVTGNAMRNATVNVFLLREMVRRDFQGRYAGSTLGFFWSFVHPLVQLLLFTFVFSIVIGVRADPRWPGVGFAATLFAGLLPWMAMQEGVLRSVTAITDNANLVKKLSFPSELLVLSVVLAALLHEAIAAAVFVAILIATQALSLTSTSMTLTFTPMTLFAGVALLAIALVLQVLVTVGLGLLGAAAHVFFRDLAQLLALAFPVWFYLTPIIYALPLVPEPWRRVLAWNPLTPIVDLYRQAFFGGGHLIVPAGTWMVGIVAIALAWAGLRLFVRLKPVFADEV